jgi:protein SCO1/2
MCEIKPVRLSIAFAVLLLFVPGLAQAAAPKQAVAAKSDLQGLGVGTSSVELLSEDGKPFRLDELKGKPRVQFFGFTNCPVVCPVTVWEIDAALAEIGEPAKDTQIVFVTLDPARDTPAVMKKYFSGFKGRVVPLSGTEASVHKIARAFDINWQKVNTGKGDYTLDHTALAFLINAEGQVVDTVAFGASRELSVSRLRKLLGVSAK